MNNSAESVGTSPECIINVYVICIARLEDYEGWAIFL